MKFSSTFRNCQNGVKRRRDLKPKAFVRSNFVSNNVERVKGHKAKRLFTHNHKRVNKECDFDQAVNKHQNDEMIFQQALDAKQKLTDLVNNGREELNAKLREMNCDELFYAEQQQKLDKEIADQKAQTDELQKQASQRQMKRIAFLKNPQNKICYICGGRGHVSKDCTSQKKKDLRQKRATTYKKHLIKTKAYKIDLDGEYKRLREMIKNLELRVSKLEQGHVEVAQVQDSKPSKEVDSQKEVCETQTSVKFPEQVTKCCDTAITRDYVQEKTIYEMSYDELKEHFAHSEKSGCSVPAQSWSEFIRSVGCALLMLFAIVTVLLLVEGSTYAMNHLRNITLPTIDILPSISSVEFTSLRGWNSFCCWPSKSVLIAIIVSYGILRYICLAIFRKADGLVRWQAMSNYRQQLKDNGCTYRLPYCEKQLGTSDYSYTSKGEFQSVYNTTVGALNFFSVLGYLMTATKLVLKQVYGQVIFITYSIRHVMKTIGKIFGTVKRMLVDLITIIGKSIPPIYFVLLLIAATLFVMYDDTGVVYSIVYQIARCIVNWVNPLTYARRAWIAMLQGCMTFSTQGIMRLTIAMLHFFKLDTLYQSLITCLCNMFRQG